MGRAPDSKPGITGFESLVSRHFQVGKLDRLEGGPQNRYGGFNSRSSLHRGRGRKVRHRP